MLKAMDRQIESQKCSPGSEESSGAGTRDGQHGRDSAESKPKSCGRSSSLSHPFLRTDVLQHKATDRFSDFQAGGYRVIELQACMCHGTWLKLEYQ